MASLRETILFFLNNRRDSDSLRWYIRHAGRLERFRNCHAGEDCFIIGNGPSLRTMDLSPLAHYHTFGLNKIYLILDQVDLNLSYHVSVNPLVIEQSSMEFRSLGCQSFLSYKAARPVVGDDEYFQYLFTNAHCSFYGDVTRPIYEGYTVTYVALQLAYFMGFSRVFLIGVDHSFVVNGKPNEQQRLTGADQNHFHPSYFAGKDWHLPDLEASEVSYHLSRFFYQRDGRRIFDATVDGKLQVFPKISYDDALQSCGRKG